ncbi:MAG: FAD-dependent oxidoreductase [Chloroflexi bacterium]|nr:FAD-dependent oxidoreductase [Chloroflexota bacterium]
MTLSWLVVGAGIHGMHAALQLVARGRVPHAEIRILDPHETPLHVWTSTTRAVGMSYLRSPSVHNLHWDQGSLNLYARVQRRDNATEYIAPYSRPSLSLFNAHASHVIAKHRLDFLLECGTVHNLRKVGTTWIAETERGTLQSRNVVLALGRSNQPDWPGWARPFRGTGRIVHAFERYHPPPAAGETTVIVGGGLTAVQIAAFFARDGSGRVVLIHRRPFRVHDFDADVGWMNPIHLRGFAHVPSWIERRRIISEARHRGSITADVAERLRTFQADGLIDVIQSEVQGLQDVDSMLALHTDAGPVLADRIILATGFERRRPGGPLIDSLVYDHGLPVAEDGYPIPSLALRWAPGLYVMGALAELQVGPAANNIVGARLAAQRILSDL